MKSQIIPLLTCFFIMPTALADDVTITHAAATKTGDNLYQFRVTLKHADTGWDHYTNQWQIFSPDGQLLGTRTLYHPHVHEQPFTRSLGNVKIPNDIKQVIIKARDSVHGVSPQDYTINLDN